MSKAVKLPAVLLFIATLPAFAALAADAPNNIDVAKSSIVATFKQSGVPVNSPFKKFTGRIVYDAANVAASSATVEVDAASLDIGDEEYNAEVRKKQWFDVATYPKITFKSTAIKSTAPGSFVATGTLTVKGKAQTISVPIKAVTPKSSEKKAATTPKSSEKTAATGMAFEGGFTISRKTFGLGDPLWEDVLEDKVSVRFALISSGR